MAKSPIPVLNFSDGCPDCGTREVTLPQSLPDLGDDFNWHARDYEGFRMFMLEELAARFPERSRWTAADQEVVLVESLAWALDQVSDMLDRVTHEGSLEIARRTDSIQRLLNLIGYYPDPDEKLEAARLNGPRAVHNQRRMVTVDDYALRLEEHPLVVQAHSMVQWRGSWNIIRIAPILWGNFKLDNKLTTLPANKEKELKDFRYKNRLPLVPANTYGEELLIWLETYRMSGQEIRLENPVWVGVIFSVSVRVGRNYYKSEVKRALLDVLSNKSGGFFEMGRLRFGEDLHSSDLIQTVMQVDGVENICILRFSRVDNPDQTITDTIVLSGLEVAVCDNNPKNPGRGWLQIDCQGGRLG
jgi:hypothetical protein